jgi:hypothetical protein
MADAVRYVPFALLLGSTPVGFSELNLMNDARIDEIRSGASLQPDLLQVIGKRPALQATIFDPSLVTAWAEFGSGKTITQISGHWRALLQNGGPTGSWLSRAMAGGVVMPVSLNAPVDQKATLQILALAHFAAGSAVTHGTTSATAATVAKAFYPTSIVIGTDTVVAIRSLNINWNYGVLDDDQLEPAYYVYEQFGFTGSAQLKDLSKSTQARFEDGSAESVTVLLTDANSGANTVSIALGTCKVFTTISGNQMNVNFTKLAA